MSLENNQPVKSDENQEADRKVDNSRRSFAKKSAAIAPVIMTLANRSAWGGEFCVGNQSVQGFDSYAGGLGMNSHTTKTPQSNWKNPGYWLNNTNSWPSGFSAGTLPSAPSIEYQQLQSGGLAAYQMASVLNNANTINSGGFPGIFLPPSGAYYNDLNATQVFYGACATD